MTGVADSTSRAEALGLLARHLRGSGVELGPGHNPLPLPYTGTEVQYVDRWEPDENSRLCAELGPDAQFPKPDVIANLDTDRLSAVPTDSQDYVVASHLLEHLAEPLGILADISRVLRPGGTLLLLLPDRRRTFDLGREPTPLAHLVAEHAAGVSEVSDEHLLEWIAHVSDRTDWTPEQRTSDFDLHRRRSIHVHCWTQEEFDQVLVHTIASMGAPWELVELLRVEDVPASIEFGYVLRKAPQALPPDVAADRLRQVIAAEGAARAARPDVVALAADRDRLATECVRLAAVAADLRKVVAHQGSQLDLFRRSPLAPVLRRLWRGWRALRRR